VASQGKGSKIGKRAKTYWEKLQKNQIGAGRVGVKKSGTNLKNARKRNNKIKTNQTKEKSETIKQS
jgi:hypothetical protein